MSTSHGRKPHIVFFILLASIFATESFAGRHPRIQQVNGRERNQQRRIAQGVENGSLNAREATRLERQEANLKRRENREIRQNGGHLTGKEQRQLNQQENRLSNEIYRDKHN